MVIRSSHEFSPTWWGAECTSPHDFDVFGPVMHTQPRYNAQLANQQ